MGTRGVTTPIPDFSSPYVSVISRDAERIKIMKHEVITGDVYVCLYRDYVSFHKNRVISIISEDKLLMTVLRCCDAES